jgi:hypothetical protein
VFEAVGSAVGEVLGVAAYAGLAEGVA